MAVDKLIRLLCLKILLLVCTKCACQQSFINFYDYENQDNIAREFAFAEGHFYIPISSICGIKQCGILYKIDTSGIVQDSVIFDFINTGFFDAFQQYEDKFYLVGQSNNPDSTGFYIVEIDSDLSISYEFYELNGLNVINVNVLEVTENYVLVAIAEVLTGVNPRVPTIHVVERESGSYVDRIEISEASLNTTIFLLDQLTEGSFLVAQSTPMASCEADSEEKGIRFIKLNYPDFAVIDDTTKYCRLEVFPAVKELPNGQIASTSNHFSASEDVFPIVHLMNNTFEDLEEISGEQNGAVVMEPLVSNKSSHYFIDGFKYEYYSDISTFENVTWLRKMSLEHDVNLERHYKIPNYSMSFLDIHEAEDGSNYVLGVIQPENGTGTRDVVLIKLTENFCYFDDCSDVIIIDVPTSVTDITELETDDSEIHSVYLYDYSGSFLYKSRNKIKVDNWLEKNRIGQLLIKHVRYENGNEESEMFLNGG